MSQGTKAVLDDLKHAGEFTKIENTAVVYVLRGWFGSLSAIPGALEAGDDAWAFTTLQEHFDSKLNPDPTKRTPEQVKILGELQKKAKKTHLLHLGKFNPQGRKSRVKNNIPKHPSTPESYLLSD